MNLPTLHPATLEFLKAINEHNSRKYFASIRPLYDQVMSDVEMFCQGIIDVLSNTDPRLRGVKAKSCLFRIYRDARRIKDGDPIYKNNFGFHISPTGKKSSEAGYYIHIQSGESFFGGGIYRPSSEQIMKIRAKLINHGDEYLKLTSKKEFIGRFGQVQGDVCKTMPRGFAADIPHADLVKRKQHLIYHAYTDEEILRADFAERIIEDCKIAKPWFDWLNDIEKDQNESDLNV